MTLTRVAEQDIIMESQEAVDAFDGAGEVDGPLAPIYHFNAEHFASHLPQGSTWVDLMCGSGRLLRYLLAHRPDLRAIGVDLSSTMLDLAARELDAAGLSERATLVTADGNSLDSVVTEPVAGVACLSALHHCPTQSDLVGVLEAVRRLSERHDATVWLFDLVRPEKESMLQMIPRLYELSSRQRLEPAFRVDWENSLHAGWTFEEFQASLVQAQLPLVGSNANYSQLHRTTSAAGPYHGLWNDVDVDTGVADRAAHLAESLDATLV